MKVCYGQLRDKYFGQAFNKVSSFVGYKSPQTAYNIAKINKAFLDEVKLCDEEYIKLLKQYAQLDAEGEFIPPEGQPKGHYQITDGKLKDWEAALEKFNAVEIDLAGRRSLNLEEIMAAGLSPLDISVLDCLIAPPLEVV